MVEEEEEEVEGRPRRMSLPNILPLPSQSHKLRTTKKMYRCLMAALK